MTQTSGPGELTGEIPGTSPSSDTDRPNLLGQRRSFLINKRYQLKASVLTGTVVLILLVFINLILYSASVRSSAEILAQAPEFADIIRAQDQAQFYLILLASLVFLVGVFVVSILETHKTAGAAFNLGRRMGELRDGNYRSTLALRRGDHLLELEYAFNRLSRSLRERTWEDLEELESITADADSSEISARLTTLARRIRTRVD